MKHNLFIFLLLLIIIVPTASAYTVTMSAATATSSMEVDLSANTTAAGNYTYAFLIGTSASSTFYQTAQATGTGTSFAQSMKGYPLMAGKTYYASGAVWQGTDYEVSPPIPFTLSAHPAVTYTTEVSDTRSLLDDFIDAEYDMEEMGNILTQTWTNVLGNIFFGLMFGILFIVMWIRMNNVTIPLIMLLLTGTTLTSTMPAEWQALGVAMVAVAMAGFIYTLFKKRRVES